MPQSIAAMDPVDRLVDFRPTKQPYDPRHMLTGAADNGNRALCMFSRWHFLTLSTSVGSET